MAKREQPVFRGGLCFLLSLVLLFVGCVGGVLVYLPGVTPASEPLPASGDIAVHFLELGNAYTGDCTYIKAGDVDILIDAGSRTDSVSAISDYIDRFVTDGKLEYVIVTHAHQDHYAGFATNATTDSIFDLYECGTIIDFALTNQKEDAPMYTNYKRELADEIAAGATHYTAAECIRNGHALYDLGNDITLKILDSYYYYNESDTENNYSVCCLLTQGETNYLFTGDLEKSGEEKLVSLNALPKVDLYKAGHHGSKTSSSAVLMSAIQPDVVCVCCCCGSAEYTTVDANQFPTQEFVDRVAPYTDRVYVTTACVDWGSKTFSSMNGNITVTGSHGAIIVSASNNTTILKDTVWFSEHRVMPDEWKK